jgi:GDP-L-fucose synthase
VILCAGKVGGIIANQNAQADFLLENMAIASNVIGAAAKNHVSKLLYLGSSCVYPKLAPQPIQEESLLTSALEPTNEGYAIAKIAGLKLCEMYQRQ